MAVTGRGAGADATTGGGATTGCGGGATGTGSGGATICGAGAAAGILMRTAGEEPGTAGAGVVLTVGTFTLIRGGAAEGDEGTGLAAGGGAISVGGATQVGGGAVTAPGTLPNWRFTSSLIRADKSAPHSGHAKVTGWRTISGEASKAYLLPQSQRIFIRHQGLGFNRTTFVLNGRAIDAAGGEDFMPPSQNKKVPPYL
jgi:hypothetical protein